MKEKTKDLNLSEGHCDIYRVARELRTSERRIMDFSMPTNPLGVSKKIKAELRKHLKYIYRYPDAASERLRKRIAQYHGIDERSILCGNGSAELLYLIARTLRPRHALMAAPISSLYEKAVLVGGNLPPGPGLSDALSDEGGIEISYAVAGEETGFEIVIEDFIAAMRGDGDALDRESDRRDGSSCSRIAFLCNPGNPTGVLLPRGAVVRIADAAREAGYYLVVDEAFIDFCPDESVVRAVQDNPRLIVLRSMSSFYALSGLRFGYGVFPGDLVERLEWNREPWTVNSLAQMAAAVALKDKAFKKETLTTVRAERQFVERNLRRMGIEAFPSTTNFSLVKMKDAVRVSRSLMKKGILLGGISDFKGLDQGFIRIAVRSHRENAVLIRELREVLDQRG